MHRTYIHFVFMLYICPYIQIYSFTLNGRTVAYFVGEPLFIKLTCFQTFRLFFQL